MNLKESLQALIDGKKIRRRDWSKEKYIQFANDKIKDHYGERYCFTISDDSNFELYEEPKKPIDVLNEAWKTYLGKIDPLGLNLVVDLIIKILNEKENERE